ncbi:hypothetical protein [Methylogaea oryzae]|uniref:hypothetical protein n=1 Tax=Methylogaea oryzae TaxID=1295382 RepID=UPI001C3F3836|nr:hypothetical protein [Methylogaea oryzae]
MATVLFWEKPGCVNNARQKRLLQEAGHTVLARDLLAELGRRNPCGRFSAACRWRTGSTGRRPG